MMNAVEYRDDDNEQIKKVILDQLLGSIANLERLLEINPDDIWAQNEIKKKRLEFASLKGEES